MGVEWDLGCERCARFLWLGSQKPYKWRGFQVGEAAVRRFMGLHDNRQGCALRLTNDGTRETPWEEGAERGWSEDVLSRSFWDSWSREGLQCGHCGVQGPPAQDPDAPLHSGPASGPGLLKSVYLWFCGEPCFADYCAHQRSERDRVVYDSTGDPLPPASGGLLAVACLACRVYQVVDGAEDGGGTPRDMESLALFLSEHVGRDYDDHPLAIHHLLPGEADPSCPWRGADAERWRPHLEGGPLPAP